MYDAHTRFVTVAHVSSESGDHFLETFDGALSESEVQAMVFEDSPDWWVDADDVWVREIQHIRFIGEQP
jgi:hypothetical protein